MELEDLDLAVAAFNEDVCHTLRHVGLPGSRRPVEDGLLFAVEIDSEPDGEELIKIFRDEFGYDPDDSDEDEQYEHLYDSDDIEITSDDFTQI